MMNKENMTIIKTTLILMKSIKIIFKMKINKMIFHNNKKIITLQEIFTHIVFRDQKTIKI